jgi:hypothetical protein
MPIGLKRDFRSAATLLALGAILTTYAQGAAAQQADEWRFGIGTGLGLLDLDGDVGFATEGGGFVGDLDLDNGDTGDMVESAFGFASFANKGRWTINLSYKTLTLEDDDSGVDAEWDRVEANLNVEYAFAQTGNHTWGVFAGARYFDHEWDFDLDTGESADAEDDWTDAVVGLTHRVPFAEKWAWSNEVDYMFGDSEGGYTAQTGINWQPWTNWVFNLSLRYQSLEYGDEDDIDDDDFYYYDVDEITTGLGFMYVW